jgi:hypothetical protein
MVRTAALGLALSFLALTGCDKQAAERNVDTLDNELIDGKAIGNARDPAMMGALQDQIMVDPSLAAQANNDAVRPPVQPVSGAVPPDGIAAGSSGAISSAMTSENMRYSTRWSQRLPGDLPLYPDARVAEAAGNDANGCSIRAVSFSSSAPLQKVLDWYYTRATNAGFSAEHQANGAEHVLGGTRGRDDGAFALFLTSRSDGGTDVDMVANNGS